MTAMVAWTFSSLMVRLRMFPEMQEMSSSSPGLAGAWAIGDLDNDGRLDSVVTTNDGPLHILHNETVSSHSLAAPEPCGTQE